MKKVLDIKFKVGDIFYFINDGEVKSGLVDKVEVFKDYFRYVNEDKSISVNWFTNESVDNDRTIESDALTIRIFTTHQKAADSYEFRHAQLHNKVNNVRCLLIDIKNMKDTKLFYPEEKISEIQTLLDEVSDIFVLPPTN